MEFCCQTTIEETSEKDKVGIIAERFVLRQLLSDKAYS